MFSASITTGRHSKPSENMKACRIGLRVSLIGTFMVLLSGTAPCQDCHHAKLIRPVESACDGPGHFHDGNQLQFACLSTGATQRANSPAIDHIKTFLTLGREGFPQSGEQ